MKFFSGEQSNGAKIMKFYKKNNWGRMFVMREPTPFEWEDWAFDNGAYIYWKRDVDFQEDDYKKRLEKAVKVKQPYLSVVPDKPTKGLESLKYSLEWRKKLPGDMNWYLAVQDGMTIRDVKPHLDKFKGIFLGGSSKFKGTAYYWCKLAHQNDMKFHYGRAGTKRTIQHAKRIGADSADSAFPLWTKERQKNTVKLLNKNISKSLFSNYFADILPTNYKED